MVRRLCMITTEDNPYNPLDDFGKWFKYDLLSGRNTVAYLGKFMFLDSSLSDKDYDEEVERAVDEIVKHNPLGIYKKVVKEIEVDYDTLSELSDMDKNDEINDDNTQLQPENKDET